MINVADSEWGYIHKKKLRNEISVANYTQKRHQAHEKCICLCALLLVFYSHFMCMYARFFSLHTLIRIFKLVFRNCNGNNDAVTELFSYRNSGMRFDKSLIMLPIQSTHIRFPSLQYICITKWNNNKRCFRLRFRLFNEILVTLYAVMYFTSIMLMPFDCIFINTMPCR